MAPKHKKCSVVSILYHFRSRSIGEFWDLGLSGKVLLSNATNKTLFFLAPSSWSNIGMRSIKIESVVFAGLAFSAVTIAVSEAFLLPIAENWPPVTG